MNDTSSASLLANALYESKHCASLEEATAVTYAIVQEIVEKRTRDEQGEAFQELCIAGLQDYLALTTEEAREIVQRSFSPGQDESDEEEDSNDEILIEDDSEDDGELLEQGECELCERLVQLTKHHLIPKSTWPRIEPKLLHAAEAMEQEHMEKAQRIVGPGLEHTLQVLKQGHDHKTCTRAILQRTCLICRPCHSAIHQTHDNMTLALQYNTVDMLLQDPQVYRYCQWASKQKPGQYALRK